MPFHFWQFFIFHEISMPKLAIKPWQVWHVISTLQLAPRCQVESHLERQDISWGMKQGSRVCALYQHLMTVTQDTAIPSGLSRNQNFILLGPTPPCHDYIENTLLFSLLYWFSLPASLLLPLPLPLVSQFPGKKSKVVPRATVIRNSQVTFSQQISLC